MKDSFNSNFYITAATVIPLLYITLFLQSQMIQNLAKWVTDINEKRLMIAHRIMEIWADKSFRIRLAIMFSSTVLIAFIFSCLSAAILIMTFAGAVSEALTFWVLYYQTDSVWMRRFVLWSIFALLLLVCSGPTITIIRNLTPPASPDVSGKEAKHKKIT